jgi:hypothetical protein
VRENICYMVPVQQLRQFTDAFRLPKSGKLIGFAVRDKPVISTQPAMSNPDAVSPSVMPPVADVLRSNGLTGRSIAPTPYPTIPRIIKVGQLALKMIPKRRLVAE